MGSQFVDFNGDGHIDYFTATFDGFVHVAYGSENGFAEPIHVRDRNGKRVMLAQHWDYDSDEQNKWTNTGDSHCTSAVAFDWDGDGDYDLLLGDYSGGNLFLQRNEGKAGAPSFTGANEPVLAGGQPFALDGGLTAPRLVDWDGDGLTDLVCGSFGDSYQGKSFGGVYLYRNVGAAGAPRFAAAHALIAPQKGKGTTQDRPNVGLYADPVDYDGDGDLDLVVGGYSLWTPVARALTAAETQRLAEVKKELDALDKQMDEVLDAAAKKAEALGKDERQAEMMKTYKTGAFKKMGKAMQALRAEQAELEPGSKRKPAVWVYLRASS